MLIAYISDKFKSVCIDKKDTADPPIASASKEGKEKGSTPKGKKGKKKLILIAGIVLFLVAGAGAVIFFSSGLTGGKGHSKEVKEASANTRGHIYSMDPFVVNLMDTEPQRYLKVKIDIESHEAKADEEFEKRLPQLRDIILTILTSKTYKEIYDSEGKKKLKEEIILKSNQLLGNSRVKSIYYTEFVVQ
jgi:flagellar FliL protein